MTNLLISYKPHPEILKHDSILKQSSCFNLVEFPVPTQPLARSFEAALEAHFQLKNFALEIRNEYKCRIIRYLLKCQEQNWDANAKYHDVVAVLLLYFNTQHAANSSCLDLESDKTAIKIFYEMMNRCHELNPTTSSKIVNFFTELKNVENAWGQQAKDSFDFKQQTRSTISVNSASILVQQENIAPAYDAIKLEKHVQERELQQRRDEYHQLETELEMVEKQHIKWEQMLQLGERKEYDLLIEAMEE